MSALDEAVVEFASLGLLLDPWEARGRCRIESEAFIRTLGSFGVVSSILRLRCLW